ncbi:MAG TPA: branched-chain amino acid ABC transporter substrate-binding protein [Burkholderiales bacterium]
MKSRFLALLGGLLLTTAAAAEIRIGVVGPLTGSLAAFGEQMRRGGEMAVADLNARGGVLGQKVVLEVGDDACDPKQAVAVANQMVNRGVVFVAGHFCSSASIPASDVYAEEGLLQISPASTNPTFTERKLPTVFRTCGRDDQQGKIAGEYIARHFKNVNVAILHDKTAYGKGLADETKRTLNALGKKETIYEAITAGEKDYSALVSKLKSANIGLIYLGGYHPEGGLIVRQARQQGLNATLMGGDALMTEEYWAITGAAGEGTLMTFSPDPSRNPIAKPVVDRFLQQGYKPEGYTLYTYGAIQAWAQAAEAAKTTKAAAVAKVLKSGQKFNTILGDISFDAKGDVSAPGYVVYVWKNGKYDYAEN